jgi:hypothetical protein
MALVDWLSLRSLVYSQLISSKSCCHPHFLPPTGSDPINAILDATTSIERQARQKEINTLKGNKTQKNNYTERTPKGKRLSSLGGCLIPGPKETKMVVC